MYLQRITCPPLCKTLQWKKIHKAGRRYKVKVKSDSAEMGTEVEALSRQELLKFRPQSPALAKRDVSAYALIAIFTYIV